MAYTEVSISSYNATPPTDDGASGATNTITWAKIKEKLGDPLNTAITSIDDNVAAACNSLDTSITTANTNITNANTSITTAQSSLYAPATTATFFVQTAAPTLWTKVTTHNDKALRLVSGTVSTGGSTAFTSVFTSRTITTAEMPAHTHTITVTNQAVTLSRTSWTTDVTTDTNTFTNGSARNADTSIDETSGTLAATISHSGTSGSAGSGTAMDFAVQYVDVILATKD